MKPPWEEHPDIRPRSIGWRMGEGECYMESFWSYYNSLPPEEQDDYRRLHRPPLRWSGFYQRGTTKYVIANIGVMALLFSLLIWATASFIAPAWWIYFLVVPIAFLIAGFAEERLLSGIVNRFVDLLFNPHQKTSS